MVWFCFVLRRIALRRDTVSAIGLSLNMSAQTSDVIWHCHSLPFDSAYCLAVPRPIGESTDNVHSMSIHTVYYYTRLYKTLKVQSTMYHP